MSVDVGGAGVHVVLVTAPDEETAATVGGAVVEEGLAACANLLPGVRSLYRWEGEMQDDREVLLILKTTPESEAALRTRVVELHPYDVPEVLALPVGAGHGPYLAWVRAQTEG